MATKQEREWQGDFGAGYTDRNPSSGSEVNELYAKRFGVTRTAMNGRFLAAVPKDARILEVGTNTGSQLVVLNEMGFTDLSGVEISDYALNKAKQIIPSAKLSNASALSLPFEDNFFDLVFTSGVLIHIAPADLPRALDEISRVSKKWVWGFEYYSPKPTEIEYRGNRDLLWKNDFKRTYLERRPELRLVENARYAYKDNSGNEDEMFLLEK
ncbi:MAG: pseudaminic acid biosynthesis-associated methylase [Candidatus Micrarchaeia archaeon]